MTDIYVSSSTGSDTNAGDQSHPLKSINAAQANNPTTLYLARADTWSDQHFQVKSGVHVRAWGDINKPRPRIMSAKTVFAVGGIGSWNADNAGIHDVEIVGQGVDRNSATPAITVCGNNFVWEKVKISLFVYGLQLGSKNTSDGSGVHSDNIKLIGGAIIGCWGKKKSQGIYGTHVTSLLVTGGFWIENCGFLDDKYATSDVYSHGVYLSESCGPSVWDSFTVKKCGNAGLQLRSGGRVLNGRIEDCPVALMLGDVSAHPEVEVGNMTILGGSARANNSGWAIWTRRVHSLNIHDTQIGWKAAGVSHGSALLIRNETIGANEKFDGDDKRAWIPTNGWSFENARHVQSSSQTVVLKNTLFYNWNAGKIVDAQLNSGTLAMTAVRLFQEPTYASTVLYMAGGSYVDGGGNQIATVQKPNSYINNVARDLPLRVPFPNIPKP